MNRLVLTEVKVKGDVIDLSNEEYEVSWSIGEKTYTGREIELKMNEVGVSTCSVTISKINNLRSLTTSIVWTYSFSLASKYIRRELRSMTDADREEFLSTMQLIYSLDGTYGRQKYGNKFKSAEEFQVTHLNGAGTSDCDHWHDGGGILTHHTAISLEFEQALQSIKPFMALPYWEYGQDIYRYSTYDKSDIFKANWFGAASGLPEEQYRIADGGRWDSLRVPSGEKYYDWDQKTSGSLNPYVNAYGMLRAPWNNVPSYNVGRRNKIYGMQEEEFPTDCNVLKSCFLSSSLKELNGCVNGKTHGPVHILIGVSWDPASLLSNDQFWYLRGSKLILMFKILWRQGWTRCPTSCESGKTCLCSIPDEYIQKYGARHILTVSNIIYLQSEYLSDKSEEYLELFLRAIEDPGHVGDMLTSSAAYDPTFWPLHGSLDRLVGLKRIKISDGTITDTFDETWGFDSYNLTNSYYLEGRCDWSNVNGVTDLTLPNCDKTALCHGHQEHDILEFKNFQNKDEVYTNREFYNFLHPWTTDLPYVYDTYKFTYCADEGYDFFHLSRSDSASYSEEYPNYSGM